MGDSVSFTAGESFDRPELQPTIPLLRRTIGPLALMLATPPLALTLWLVTTRYGGSVERLLSEATWATWLDQLPRPSVWALVLVACWCAFQWALLLVLPGPEYLGPLTASGARPVYKKNGLAAWGVTHALLVAGFASGVLSATSFYHRYGELLSTLALLAFAVCAILYVKARHAPNSPDRVVTGYPLFDYFQGIELHPTIFGTSLKQLVNSRIAMMGWSAVVVSFCAHQFSTPAGLSSALLVSSAIVIVYLFKFFLWETGYFASLDVMHDRFGYYICGGVLAWVPAVYPSAQLYLTATRRDIGPVAAAACLVLGVVAIALNYAADAQRQLVRQTGGQCEIWGGPPRVIRARYRGRDGLDHENLLLVSGYWGIARHFHYAPEVCLALAWTLPAGLLFAPYVYVVFLTLLLLDRAGRDDKRCERKYGSAWGTYRKLVPYKVIPLIY
jgi:7-dehydrocholesterol reductase